MLDAAVSALYPDLRHIQSPVELADRQEQLDQARAALGTEAYQRALSEGAALRFEEVVMMLDQAGVEDSP